MAIIQQTPTHNQRTATNCGCGCSSATRQVPPVPGESVQPPGGGYTTEGNGNGELLRQRADVGKRS